MHRCRQVSFALPLLLLVHLVLSPCCVSSSHSLSVSEESERCMSSIETFGATEESDRDNVDETAALQVSLTHSTGEAAVSYSPFAAPRDASVRVGDINVTKELQILQPLRTVLPSNMPRYDAKAFAVGFMPSGSTDATANKTKIDDHWPQVQGSPAKAGFKALCLGILSGLSMPIGVVLGIAFAPVSDRLCGRILAFGSGALLFAVTVSIYGNSLTELELGKLHISETGTATITGLLGASFYLYVARWLDGDQEEQEVPDESDTERDTSGTSSSRRRDKAYRSLEELTESDVNSNRVEATMRRQTSIEQQKQLSAAYGLFAGLLIDGIPEGIFLGFLAYENRLTFPLLLSLFISNFPEAFYAASMMQKAGMSYSYIFCLWGGLCLIVGLLSGLSCYALLKAESGGGAGFADIAETGIAASEGFTGGAMLACISTLMLPEAQERVGKSGSIFLSSGFLAVAGFLCAIGIAEIETALDRYLEQYGDFRGVVKYSVHQIGLMILKLWPH